MGQALLVLSAAAAIGWGIFLADLVLGQRYIQIPGEETGAPASNDPRRSLR